MEIQNWIGIGLIIATVFGALGTTIAPTIAALVQYRLAQKAEDAVKRTTLIERLSRWLQKPIFDWVPITTVIVSAYMLYRELSSSEPITRASVLNIAVCVATIASNFIFFLVERIINSILEILHSTTSVLQRHVEVTKEMSQNVLGISEHLVEESEVPKAAMPKKKKNTSSLKVDKSKLT